LQCLMLVLRKHNLLQSSEFSAKNSSNVIENDSDDSVVKDLPRKESSPLNGQLNADTPKPSQIVSLWPMYEQTAILAHMWHMTHQPQCGSTGTESGQFEDASPLNKSQVCLRDFVLSHSPDLLEARVQASDVSSNSFCLKSLERKWLSKSVDKLLQLLKVVLPDSGAERQMEITESQEETINMIQDTRNLLTSLATTTSLPEKMLALVSRCLEVTQEALESTSPVQLGRGFVYVGLVLAKLLAPMGPVDPVEKAALKLGHVQREIEEVDAELATWNQYLEIHTSRGIKDTQAQHLHPRVLYLLQRKEKLLETSVKLKSRQAYRPDKLQYSKLVQAVTGFMETTCDSSRVLDVVSKLMGTTALSHTAGKRNKAGLADAASPGVLLEERVWQDTTARFLDRLLDTFTCFQDILSPFVIAVYQMKLGLRLMASRFERDLKVQRLKVPVGRISSLVHQLCTFPSVGQHTPNLLMLADNLASSASIDLVTGAMSGAGVLEDQSSSHTVSVMKSRQCHSVSTGRLDDDLVSSLMSVLAQFASAWQEQEERRRQKEAEEGALYKYKEKTHGDERSEKEIEEADFRASYPSFEKDFIDVTGADRLEDVGQESSADASQDTGHLPGLDSVSTSEMDLVCSVHHSVFTSLSQADWITGTEEVIVDEDDSRKNNSDASDEGPGGRNNKLLLSPALMAYQIGAEMVKSFSDVLSPETDAQIVGSHVVVGTSALQHIQLYQDPSQGQSSVSSSYNIYYDENVTEVLRCRRVLASLATRVAELQQEWPDHPTLVLLNQIMSRIESFSVLSPVVKYLTGLELLLQKAQDWESNAASFVSLSPQLAEITSVIVEWRKLELSCWRNSLDREEQKCQVKASHWWFHLYQLTTSFLQSDADDTSTGAGILTALKTFMETSTLGEFSVRLRMLFAFHCQLLHANKCPAQESLLHTLWNVYQFYKQYQPNVEAEVKRLRLPIEKQLKGFVKIARWSDMNYWALKDSTEKTHRAVHKRVKEYQAVLSQPAKSMLGDSVDDLVTLAVKQTSGFQLEEKMKAFSVAVVKSLAQTKLQDSEKISDVQEFIKDCELLKRAPRLFKKMKVHLKKCLMKSNQSKKILAFDNFTGELIQEMHELHGLQVDTAADKDKQKSEAKSIDLRKRKGLSEMFKYLTLIGLSYRKGLTGSNLLALSEALEMQPLNLSPHQQLPATKLWTGSESYFYRCISRYAQFVAAIGNPSKELGMADIQRCRGFVTHLGHLYLQQKSRLTHLVNHHLTLRKLMSCLATLGEVSVRPLPPQSHSKAWLDHIKSLTTGLTEGLDQVQLLLDSCPRPQHQTSTAGQDIYPSPFQPHRLPAAALWAHGDQYWLQCMQRIEDLSNTVQQERAKLDSLLEKSILGRTDMESVSSVLEVYESLVPIMSSVIDQFKVRTDEDSNNSSSGQLVTSLSYLRSEITQTRQSFHQWWDSAGSGGADLQGNSAVSQTITKHRKTRGSAVNMSESQTSDEGVTSQKFMGDLEQLVETLLLSVQNIVHVETISGPKGENLEAPGTKPVEDGVEEEEEEELEESHLSEHLLEREKKTISNLNCSKIIEMLSTLVEDISRMSEHGGLAGESSGCVQALLQCQPLVLAFSCLLESQVGLAVAVHRSVGKLLSVLLATFTELAQKGFCIPPELSDEMEGEGATEFQDIEGGGIGEGEGTKDVSDQIETEDQLEEAKRPDQKEQPEESQDQPDIPAEDNAIEMSDNFEGKLHDQDETEKGENDDDDDDKEEDGEEDMEKEMGEADGEQDKLDDRLWGSDDEDEEEEEDDNKESKEEDGGGGEDRQMEESVAKEDNKDAAEPKKHEEEDTQGKDKKEEDQQPNDLPENEDDYDDNKVDPHNQEEKEREAENLELPDDMTLDDGEKKGQDEEEDMEAEETPAQDEEQKDEETGEEEGDEEGEGREKDEETNENDESEKQEGDVPSTRAEEEKQDEEKEEEDGQGEDGTSAQEEEKEEKPFGELEQDEDQTRQKPQDQMDTADDKASGDATQQAQLADAAREEEERAGGGMEQEEPVVKDQEQDQDQKGVGAASSEDPEGNFGQKSEQTTEKSSSQKELKRQRKPGQTDDQRSLGSRDKEHGQLKTREEDKKTEDEADDAELQEEMEEDRKQTTSREYQHVKDPKSHWDAQTVDAATEEQTRETQAVPAQDEGEDLDNNEEDVEMEEEEKEDDTDAPEIQDKRPSKSRSKENQDSKENEASETEADQKLETEHVQVDGDRILTFTAERKPESTIHTILENLHLDPSLLESDVEEMRTELEQKVQVWSHSGEQHADLAREASEAWQKYQAITCSLSQELCEQLRLILEPSQATKLKGDYRTGKRLNMRKVIPYIASEFRKDKIWLRRSKPSKRQYQIMIAVDDSASMADNHSKQLAFESLALVSNALTLLESGDLSVCSFGEEVRVLHPFFEPFTHHSGANILQQLTCEQKQTKYGQLLDTALGLMQQAQLRSGPSVGGREQPAQLLLILSDGHGVFREGMDFVRKAVRRARQARVFLVFLLLDSPDKKGSLLDARVPIMSSSGQIQEIKSYMELFPFPFYIFLRDINSMPQILSDALRQWFELVTASHT
ncbi:midasin, partial [Elysia marginata]